MHLKGILAALAALTLTNSVTADGLYSKGSAVLQVDGKSYNKLIAKSNQVSVSFRRASDELCFQILIESYRL